MTPIGHVPTNFILFLNFSSTVVISVLKCVKSSYTPHPEPELSAVHLSLESWDSPRSGEEWFLTFSSGREHVRYSPWSTCALQRLCYATPLKDKPSALHRLPVLPFLNPLFAHDAQHSFLPKFYLPRQLSGDQTMNLFYKILWEINSFWKLWPFQEGYE